MYEVFRFEVFSYFDNVPDSELESLNIWQMSEILTHNKDSLKTVFYQILALK